MKFTQLDLLVPKVPADKENLHTNTMYISGGFGWSVRVRWPGKHGSSSGDFVVETLSEGVWDEYHQFTHSDLFNDILSKHQADPTFSNKYFPHLLGVVDGEERPLRLRPLESELPGIHVDALTNTLLALTVCEYRRFPQGDKRGGGRYLPINYTLAMLQGYWTPKEATKHMRKGFPALRNLDGFVPYTAGNPKAYIIRHPFASAEVADKLADGDSS